MGVMQRRESIFMMQDLPQPSVVVIDDDRHIVEVVCDVLDEDGIPA